MIIEDVVRAEVKDSAPEGDELLARLLQNSARLYTLPTVAVELLALTGDPRIGARELKECIERDPALTAKILRVVNSSLYGLSAEVGSLGQAVALLGIKPLKLLVLGFSLPDELFAALAAEQLERYWSTSLVRAVAAKAVAERFYQLDGDDAFIAGLMEDIGMLAMLGQLGEPYARFLQIAWDEEGDIRALERQSLGFDHSQLTTALLAQWKMPQALVDAVAAGADPRRLAHAAPTEPMAKILCLANLTAGLVGRHQLSVLPELLERGGRFCGMDKSALHALIEELEPKVADLAGALDVHLAAEGSYLQILADAQGRMAELSEEILAPLARLERAEELLAQVKSDWSKQPAASTPPNGPSSLPAAKQAVPGGLSTSFADVPDTDEAKALRDVIQRAVAECRLCRDELAVALVGAGSASPRDALQLRAALAQAGELLRTACRQFGVVHAEQWQLSATTQAVVLPHCSRREAIDLVRQVLRSLEEAPLGASAPFPQSLSAGVASVDTPPRNFDPARLLESAHRCLSAAETSGGQVKSIELY